MHLLRSFVTSTVALSVSTASSVYSNQSSLHKCTDILIALPLSSNATVAPGTSTPVIFNFSTTYNINARYCLPTNHVEGSADVLQLLVHGITYTRDYWSGLSFPGFHGNNYSWIAYAAERGYPTLSIDRLGHGLSDHPDPDSYVQVLPQVDLTHSLVQAIKNGTALPRRFEKIVYVGHSQGSLIGKSFVDKYPTDVNAIVLTGWSTTANASNIFSLLQPARNVAPRFASLEPGYVAFPNVANREPFYSVMGADYDPSILQYDFDRSDTYTLSMYQTSTDQTVPSKFPGHVFVLTGQLDYIFCANLDCGQGNSSQLAQAKVYFPSAKSYDYFVPPNTGHNVQYHFTQTESFGKTHDWMQKIGYGKKS